LFTSGAPAVVARTPRVMLGVVALTARPTPLLTQVTVSAPACGKPPPALELQVKPAGGLMLSSCRPAGRLSVMVMTPLAGNGVGPRLVVDRV